MDNKTTLERIDHIARCLKTMLKDNHPKIEWILTQIEDMNFKDEFSTIRVTSAGEINEGNALKGDVV